MRNLLVTQMDLADLRNALTRMAPAVQTDMDFAGVANARKLWAEIKPLVQAIDDGPLGVPNPEEKDEGAAASGKSQLSAVSQVSAENAKRLKRMGLDVKYCGIENEEQLFEMQESEAEEKRALESVADAKAKGIAAARARFGK